MLRQQAPTLAHPKLCQFAPATDDSVSSDVGVFVVMLLICLGCGFPIGVLLYGPNNKVKEIKFQLESLESTGLREHKHNAGGG